MCLSPLDTLEVGGVLLMLSVAQSNLMSSDVQPSKDEKNTMFSDGCCVVIAIDLKKVEYNNCLFVC